MDSFQYQSYWYTKENTDVRSNGLWFCYTGTGLYVRPFGQDIKLSSPLPQELVVLPVTFPPGARAYLPTSSPAISPSFRFIPGRVYLPCYFLLKNVFGSVLSAGIVPFVSHRLAHVPGAVCSWALLYLTSVSFS